MDESSWQQRYEALLQHYRLLETLIDAIPDHLYIKDRESRFLFANQAMYTHYDLAERAAMLGKTDHDLHPPEQATRFMAEEAAVMDTEKPILQQEDRTYDKAARELWYVTSKLPLYDTKGAVIGLAGVSHDITKRKQAELEVRRQRDIIEQQRQALLEASIPILPIVQGIIIVPLIGSLDTARARHLMRSLLKGISQHRAKVIILDITGIPMLDTSSADHLIRTVQAARLKGARMIISGVADDVAITLVELGIGLEDCETVSNLQTGLRMALERLQVNL